MGFSFEKFEDFGKRYSNYTISISRSFGIGLNAGFYHKERIKKFKNVVLHFDPKKRAIAFDFTNDDSEKGKFKISHGDNSGSIVARSFFKAKSIDVETNSGKYQPKIFEDKAAGKLFYIILKS